MPLIVFEGLDFSGKSTLAKKLYDDLHSEGLKVSVIREPGGTPVGENLRNMLLDPHMQISDFTELFLFCASRSELCEKVIHPKLENNEYVIMDRFFESTLAYQGYGRGMNIRLLTEIHEEILGKFNTYPDITYFIDVPPEICFSRANRSIDRIESQGTRFFEKVYKGYHQIAKKWYHVQTINGDRFEDDIHEDVISNLRNLKIV